jgi:hypothetical protein
MVLRYTRFFWPSLPAIQKALAIGSTPYSLAKVWNVSRQVIVRAKALLEQMNTWVGQLYQEVTDGGQPDELKSMVKIIIRKLGHIELVDRWYGHRYPARFTGSKKERHTIQPCSVND